MTSPNSMATVRADTKPRWLKTNDYNRAVYLQTRGYTLREIAQTLSLPRMAVVNELYWELRK